MMTTDERSLLGRLPSAEEGFPRVISVRDEPPLTRLTLDVTPDLCWFAGHFPNRPILPGIVQLHWATLVCRALYGFPDIPGEIKRLKFKKIVVPPRPMDLVVSQKGEYEATFRFSSLGEVNSEGTIVFPEDG